MKKEEIKAIACAAIDSKSSELIAFGKERTACPELGYAEHKTSAAVKEKLVELGVKDITTTALTGLKGWIKGGQKTEKAPSVMLMGELDAVISPLHPMADPITGAAHTCGHDAQLAVLAGCAAGIAAISQHLYGNVCIAAVPSEEYIQIEHREEMRRAGKIGWLGGKQQMIAEGALDDIDIAMMVHGETNAPAPRVQTGGTSLGFIGKKIRFIGRESHAARPWEGINALNAANLAISAIHSLRETFRSEDNIRVHPIITKGGDLVSTVPADVRMETHVRAATPKAMAETNARVNNAIKGCADALGVTVEITDIPGYYPLMQNKELGQLFTANTETAHPGIITEDGNPFAGSTDMGDISWLIPSIHPSISGFAGALHSADFGVEDDNLAFILPAKALVMTTIDLLADNAEEALGVINKYPRNTKEMYAQLWAEISK
ncbi:MAG: amidohydrolase [Defluviitaleaceae bacterium]|nr:amidohydrolase [Defluviitaleaceae bacterium]